MNIWNKVLIGLICLLAILATFWSAKVLDHYTKRGAESKKIVDETANALKSIETYKDYDKGIPMMEVRNAALLADRAENWRGCIPKSVKRLPTNRAEIVFSVKQEPVATMTVGDTIYLFDQRPFGKGGKYLGRFAISKIQGADVIAESLDVLTDSELQNLESSQQEIARQNVPVQSVQDDMGQGTQEQPVEVQAAWSIFSRCPTDRYDLFKDLSDEEKEKYLPESVLALYIQAPEDFKAIDFGTLFTYYYQKRIETSAQLAEKLMHQSTIDESNRLASEALTFSKNENEQLKSEIGQMKTQLKEIEELCDALNKICDETKTQIQETQRENERMAAEIRKMQMEALQKSGRTAAEPTSTALR